MEWWKAVQALSRVRMKQRNTKGDIFMKKILITGANSYVGTSVERYLLEYNEAAGNRLYAIDSISLRGDDWKTYDFSSYDTVFHVAGIAHADVERVSEETKKLYYQINCDLAVETAQKAKEQGVHQFIYMSSVIVYGDSAPLGKSKEITADTKPAPANFYGDSKWQAEQKLAELSSEGFHIAVIRAPMIYGKDSKGNFPILVKLARKAPFFPNIKNERSMLYIENLGEFLRLLIEEGCGGCFFPQNKEYSTTATLVKTIGEAMGRRIPLCGWLNPFVKLASLGSGRLHNVIAKAFGSLVIDQAMSTETFGEYRIYSLEESIRKIYEG